MLTWWRVSALLKFGERMVDGLLERCQAFGAAIRARVVGPRVDTALASVDVAAVVFTVRGIFARRLAVIPVRQGRRLTLRGHQRAEDAARPYAGLPLLHRPLATGRLAHPPPAGRRTRYGPPNPGRLWGPGHVLPTELLSTTLDNTPSTSARRTCRDLCGRVFSRSS
ncbi:hypothetical protein CEB94_00910 [Streptomyces hawaiiensis]|uniref:Uncharacterized protein n=1 Tax=Streptomyces hawaiiensis TaxID=67305 RepID=A0A6G5R6B9_9ACTN|nr:hypothetical protein CEB94_00910 [Streptomyces hawaiiensis]